MDIEIGQRVKKLRKETKIDQREMAERFGLSLRAYQNREQGEKSYPVGELVVLADLFNVSVEYLITGKEGDSDLTAEEQRLLRGWRKIGEEDKKFIQGIITDALLELAEKG
jgi:transcriptional regulator with XRE-family HTH domain